MRDTGATLTGAEPDDAAVEEALVLAAPSSDAVVAASPDPEVVLPAGAEADVVEAVPLVLVALAAAKGVASSPQASAAAPTLSP